MKFAVPIPSVYFVNKLQSRHLVNIRICLARLGFVKKTCIQERLVHDRIPESGIIWLMALRN